VQGKLHPKNLLLLYMTVINPYEVKHSHLTSWC